MVKIRYSGSFDQMYQDLLQDNTEIKTVVDQCVIWFRKNPEDTRLDNHALTKPMEGKWAFSITDDIRIVYECLSKTTVRFLAIGGHKRAYRRKRNGD